MTVNVMLMSVAVFTFFKQHLNKSMKKQALVVFLSKCSFGAYLIHLLILFMLDYFCHFNSLTINPVVAVPLISVIIFVVSMGISAVLNKIPVVKDYLV
jgi:surface polysaccharide O-acyltransferase-like enzyme